MKVFDFTWREEAKEPPRSADGQQVEVVKVHLGAAPLAPPECGPPPRAARVRISAERMAGEG